MRYALLGELCKDVDGAKAKANFQLAYSLARRQADKQILREKMGKP